MADQLLLSAAGRRWLVQWSLAIVGVNFLFFIIAPVARYPLTWEQALHLMQIVAPVFCGYLGSAAVAVFKSAPAAVGGPVLDEALFVWLLRGPVLIFAVASIAALVAFGVSNSPNAAPGTGMSAETLSSFFSAILAFLALTTSVLSARLFQTDQKGAQ